ncbi:MAG: HEAT repeat domain-containing protein [Bacteroidota bacterium]
MRRSPVVLFVTFFVLAVPSALTAQTVVEYGGVTANLESRWQWAQDEAQRSSREAGFWIGYSIQRLMNEDSYIVSGSVVSGSVSGRQNLYDLLAHGHNDSVSRPVYGSHNFQDGVTYASRWGKRNPFKVMKDLAILVRFGQGRNQSRPVEEVRLRNMELEVDLKGRTLFWLGTSEDDQSVVLLQRLFADVGTGDLKESAVNAIGVHLNSKLVSPFLLNVLRSGEISHVRAQAAFWLAEGNSDEALPALADVARNDQSGEVRERSLFAISLLESSAELDTLISLARTARNTEVRRKATFWLGQKASARAVETLEDMLSNDDDVEVQKQALYGLSRIPDGWGVQKLIEVAKTHPNRRIRKQAIICLGQSDDEKALQALIEIVKN